MAPLLTEVKTDPFVVVPTNASKDTLPVYRIDESNEHLVVGGGNANETEGGCRRLCLFGRLRARCAERRARREAEGKKKRCCALRIVKWGFVIMMILGLAKFFAVRHFTSRHHADCTPLESSSPLINLPLASDRTHILLHPSITKHADIHVIHSSDVNNGTVSVSLELADGARFDGLEGTEQELFICSIAKRRGVGLGIFTRGHGHGHHLVRPDVLSATIRVPKDSLTPPVHLMGRKRGHKCFKKAIRKHIIDPAIARYDEQHNEAEWEVIKA